MPGEARPASAVDAVTPKKLPQWRAHSPVLARSSPAGARGRGWLLAVAAACSWSMDGFICDWVGASRRRMYALCCNMPENCLLACFSISFKLVGSIMCLHAPSCGSPKLCLWVLTGCLGHSDHLDPNKRPLGMHVMQTWIISSRAQMIPDEQ